jgi:hypothetical protein
MPPNAHKPPENYHLHRYFGNFMYKIYIIIIWFLVWNPYLKTSGASRFILFSVKSLIQTKILRNFLHQLSKRYLNFIFFVFSFVCIWNL